MTCAGILAFPGDPMGRVSRGDSERPCSRGAPGLTFSGFTRVLLDEDTIHLYSIQAAGSCTALDG